MSSESTKRVKGFKNLFLESKYLDTTIKRNLKERKTQLAKYDKVLCASYLKNGTKYHCNHMILKLKVTDGNALLKNTFLKSLLLITLSLSSPG